MRDCVEKGYILEVLSYQEISEEFIYELLNRGKYTDGQQDLGGMWASISRNIHIPETFLRKHISKVFMPILSRRSDLSGRFVIDYKGSFQWDVMSSRYPFDLETMKEVEDKIDWEAYSRRTNIPEDIFEYYENKIDWSLINYSKCSIPLKLLEKNSHFFDHYTWFLISKYQKLSFEFILKFVDKLMLDELTSNRLTIKNLTIEENRQLKDMVKLGNIFV